MARPQHPYRDSAGKTLDDYPRPSVAVDTAVLTVTDDRLHVLLTLTNDAARGKTVEHWRLPGTFLHTEETLADAVRRSLADKAAVPGLAPTQLEVFDDPHRDDRGWVLSVAHLAAVRADRIPLIERTRLVPVDELGPLEYDHNRIVATAAAHLRADYRRRPDPEHLLPDAAPTEPNASFTIRELRLLHEAVLGETFNADTFRRTMLPGLTATGQWRSGARGKPAELYLRASDSVR
jgi:8-oxo-dGTP diphosphatase